MLRCVLAGLVLAACGAKPAPYALPAGAPVTLYVVVTEELNGARATARRLEIAAMGAVSAEGGLALEIHRLRLEMRDAAGDVVSADTEVVAGDPKGVRAEIVPWTRLLESLRAARVKVAVDPDRGVVAVEGIDRALDAAVARDATLDEPRAGLRLILSDEKWLRDLTAAGLCEIPAAVRDGGMGERSARVRVAGRGVTTMRLSGPVAEDATHLPALRVEGRLKATADFEGDGGASPPDAVGAVRVADVAGRATTSYPPESGPPLMGEWTLSTPFAGGLTIVSTTSFKLVRR